MTERLRLGVLGCGRVFERFHLPAIRASSFRLIAACEPLEPRAAWVRSACAGARIHRAARELLGRGDLDAVLVTTPPETHAELALQALDAGLHVLVEKPLALVAHDAQRIAEAAERAGRIAWTGFVRRFRRPYVELRRRCAGRRLVSVEAELVVNAAWGALGSFGGDDGKGGGVLDDVASHQLDLLPWLCGQRLVAVRGLDWSRDAGGERVRYEIRLQDGLVARLLAARGGGAWEQVAVALDGSALLAHPSGVLEGVTRSLARLATRAHFASHRLLGRPNATARSFADQMQAFGRAIAGEHPEQGADARAGVRSLAGTLALRESLRCGGTWIEVGDGT